MHLIPKLSPYQMEAHILPNVVYRIWLEFEATISASTNEGGQTRSSSAGDESLYAEKYVLPSASVTCVLVKIGEPVPGEEWLAYRAVIICIFMPLSIELF